MAERPVIVLGAGGHAKVVIDVLMRLGRRVLAAVEPVPTGVRSLLGVPVELEDAVFLNHDPDKVDLALGVGMSSKQPNDDLAARRAIAARFEARGYRFPPLIHPSAVIGGDCAIGAGAQIMAGAIVQPCCVIGPFAIVNTGARVDHDCVLGEGCHIAPGATLGGNVRVGAETLIGIGATVLQGVPIGAGALVGGGAMVIETIADRARSVGVPARI